MNIALLETCSSELASAIQSLVSYSRSQPPRGSSTNGSTEKENATNAQLMVSLTAPIEVHRVRRSILAHLEQLQTLLQQPTDFLLQLTTQTQLLACIRWLGEFQVLAFIPPQTSVPISSVADLAGVEETQLTRVVRMMATSGFLHQPQTGHVAHTALSEPFVSRPGLLDAALFLSETAAPTALQMAAATQEHDVSRQSEGTPYSLAFGTTVPFVTACDDRPRLQRQWPAYVQFGMGDSEAGVKEVLMQYDWGNLANEATVVEVGASSTAISAALVKSYPKLRYVVQMRDPNPVKDSESIPEGRITVECHRPGTIQTVPYAAVFIIHLPAISPMIPPDQVYARIFAELRVHMGVLSTDRRATLILIPSPLLQSGEGGSELVAQLRDLTNWQLANGREMEMAELLDLVTGVGDSMGRLAVVGKLSAPYNPTVALIVRYQTHPTHRASLS